MDSPEEFWGISEKVEKGYGHTTFYRGVPGFFDYAPLYDRAAQRARSGDCYVESGVWMGASAIYLCDALDKRGVRVDVDLIDRWGGGAATYGPERYGVCSFDPLTDDFLSLFLSRRAAFDHCAARVGLDKRAKVREGDALELLATYSLESLSFVFLDDCHDYEHVRQEIELVLPRLKPGGVLAGHDYCDNPDYGVKQAVDEVLGHVEIMCKQSFWYEKR